MKTISDFSRCLSRSEAKLERMDLDRVFSGLFPGFRRKRKATEAEDRAGTDYFIGLGDSEVKVDVKLLSRDPHLYGHWEFGPSLPIELWSVRERAISGYGGEADYILWLYEDSRRTVLVKREDLVAFIEGRRLEWAFFLRENENQTSLSNGTVYTSSFSWVPYYVINKYPFFRHNLAA